MNQKQFLKVNMSSNLQYWLNRISQRYDYMISVLERVENIYLSVFCTIGKPKEMQQDVKE